MEWARQTPELIPYRADLEGIAAQQARLDEAYDLLPKRLDARTNRLLIEQEICARLLPRWSQS